MQDLKTHAFFELVELRAFLGLADPLVTLKFDRIGILNFRDQPLKLIRLHQVVESAEPHSLHGGGHVGMTGQEQDFDPDVLFADLGQGFAASTMMLLSVLIVLIPWAYLEFGRRRHG